MYEQKKCSLKGDLKSTCFFLPQIDIHRVSAARGQQSEAYGLSARMQWQASKLRSPMKLLELCGEARTHRTSEPKVSVCNLKNAKHLQSKSVLCASAVFFSAAIKDHSWNLSRWTSACHLMSGKLKSESLWEGLKCFKVFHSKKSFYLNTRYLKRCFKGGI